MTESDRINAEIELDHIMVELNNNRTNHFRHFIDQYFCYCNGYVNRNGKADWGAIVFNEYVSKEALKLKEQNLHTSKNIVGKEHIIPLKVFS